MRKFVLALLLLTGVVTTANVVFAVDWENFPNGREPLYHSSHSAVNFASGNLRTSFGYGDTTYVGYTPLQGSATNPWSITASTTSAATNNVHRPPAAGCMWNWDPTGEGTVTGYVNNDSLQGFWPIHVSWANIEYPGDRGEFELPATSADYGNQSNYVPVSRNNGSGVWGPTEGGRTFGVVGIWHSDAGSNVAGAGGVGWAPLGGSQSAWCGLRRHGDLSYQDPITKQYFNGDVENFNRMVRYTAGVSTPKYPGYSDYWDQILYKDIDMSSNPSGNLTLNFKYATSMSDVQYTVGWFDKDPLTVTGNGTGTNCAEGNLISSWPDLASPADSFMVYIGAPSEGTFLPFQSACAPAVGSLPIYDGLRRWFDEVIQTNGTGTYAELVSTHGLHGTTSASVTIPNGELAPMITAGGGKVRVAFRVKTNGTSSDASNGAYNSGGAGAAQVDDVTWSISGGGSSPGGWGDFESGTSIDNTKTALQAWRSTGKPPQEWLHVDKLGNPGLPYDDLCGGETTVGRVCSMHNGVLSFGIADLNGTVGDPAPATVNHEFVIGAVSPTISFLGFDGITHKNVHGLFAPGTNGGKGDIVGTSDVAVDYEVFAKVATDAAPPNAYGILYRWILQEYPQRYGGVNTTAGVDQWGNLIRSFANYQTDAICFRSLPGITGQEGTGQALGMYKFTTADAVNGPTFGTPDSIKLGFMIESQCWATGVNACNPVGGMYLDNVSLAIVDGTPLPLSTEIWNWWNDAYPWNEGNTPGFAANFDTSGVLAKTGLDTGPANGIDSFDVPGDSIVATAFGVAPERVDLIFRILPGPGNYKQIGNPTSGLARVPQGGTPSTGVNRTAAVATANSSNFWESFMANEGPFGTHPNAAMPAAAGVSGPWNPNDWLSARCDTAEANIFAFQSKSIAGGPGSANTYQATYHESEMGIAPANAIDTYPVSNIRGGLGLPRHRCYLASPTASVTDIDCVDAGGTSGTNAQGQPYDLTYLSNSAISGWDGTNTTTEGTKIIPDGLLAPGAHVEYFWRKAENGSLTGTGLMPDTTVVVPQLGERNNDGHRWQEYSALPDRWKDTNYHHPLGLTSGSHQCMLVLDMQDSNTGDEGGWISVADSIGATSNQKWGAHNGWHAVGGLTSTICDGSGNCGVNNAANNYDRGHTGSFVAEHGGSPGTTFDLFQTKGAEDTGPACTIGSRYAHSDGSNTQINGKRQVSSPTLEQLKAFYKIILWLGGNLNAFDMGPSADRSSNDAQMVKDWLLSGSPASINRAFWITGDGVIESNEKDTGPDQSDLDANYLGVGLTGGAYGLVSGNVAKSTIDLLPNNGGLLDQDASANVNPIYGVRNTCTHTDDVLKIDATGLVGGDGLAVETNYEDPNPSDAVTYPSGIFKPWTSSHPWAALTDGFDILDVLSRFGSDSRGRLRYYNDVITRVFAGLCPNAGPPVVTLDVPNLQDGNLLADFVSLRNNPMMSSSARIHFGLAKDDRVEVKVFDVGGRLVRTLADRQFKAGEHDLVWDGSDNGGHPVQRGVYFTQVKYRGGFSDAKKLTVLK